MNAPYSAAATVGFLGPRGTFSEQAARAYVRRASGPAAAPDGSAVAPGDSGASESASASELALAPELAVTPDATAVSGAAVVPERIAARDDDAAASSVQMVPYRGIPELLTAVHRGGVDVGVVPAENSIEGTVVVTLDMLVHEVDLFIIGEVIIPVRHHLLTRNDGRHDADELLGTIRVVVSHPQALAQCRRYLQTHLPDAEVRPTLSTAAAAQQVGDSTQPGMAAIGTELCAELYGLTAVAKDIQDVSDNATRFFVVTSRDRVTTPGGAGPIGIPTGRDKTSIVFGFALDQPGNLYGALGEFANRSINLSKLESRPAKHALGHYLFFADLDGHAGDAAVADALHALAGRCAYFKVLGSYPRAAYPEVTRPRAFPPSGQPDNRCP